VISRDAPPRGNVQPNDSDKITRGIRIHAAPRFIAERSDPAAGRWFFAYTITITNASSQTVQLVSRHWIITNAKGEVEEVEGPGVVGQQPILKPGETFEYTSACPLETSMGTMHGTYLLVGPGGERFEVEIAPFTLAEPFTMN